MLFGRKEPEIVTLTVVSSMEDAEAIVSFLAENGIKSVIRDRAEEEEFMIVSDFRPGGGLGIIVKGEDAEQAAELLAASVLAEEEEEELTDEELEELAMSMAEITGLEDEEN